MTDRRTDKNRDGISLRDSDKDRSTDVQNNRQIDIQYTEIYKDISKETIENFETAWKREK